MVSYDAETRIKTLDKQLFPHYSQHVILDLNIKAKQFYMFKIISDTAKILLLDDVDRDEMERVFNKCMRVIFTGLHFNVPTRR